MENKESWPLAKRRANFKALEQDLYTYHAMKRQLKEIEEDIESIAYPQAAGGEVGYVIVGEEVDKKGNSQELRVYDFINSHSPGQTSDPTALKAQRLWDYRQFHMSSLAYREMLRRIDAIEYLLTIFRQRAKHGDDEARLKLSLIEEKYFNRRLTDCGIWQSLNISKRTFYYWQRSIIKILADQLGLVI